tara:strand:- start:424 stop:1479 length:1056 start_codon:yes stop_codon:yes gene_type:complete
MATPKEYAYYIKGNKIALVERNTAFDNDPNSRNYGPGTKDIQWESPLTSVTDALEIEYTHVPNYRINTSSTLEVNKFYVNGWTVIDGYLAFVRAHSATAGPANWTAAPYSTVGVDEYIAIEGSERWNGIHKIKARANTGILTTYTRVNSNPTIITGSSNINIGGESGGKAKIHANNNSNIYFSELFSAGDYIFISGSGTAHNNIMWEIHSVEVTADGSGEEDSAIYVANSYRCAEDISANAVVGVLNTEQIDTTPNTTAEASASITVHKVFRDFCTIQSDITAMLDEDFELDLPRYLNRAIVFYLKAKQLEDVMEVEGSEYFMAKFRKLVEEDNSNKKGKHRVMQGHWNLL